MVLRRVGRVGRIHRQGFSLLELLVVLALIGLMAAVALPAVGRQIKARTEHAELQEVLAVISGLPISAMLEGRGFTIDAMPSPSQVQKSIPADWQVAFDPPLTVTPAPSCNAAKVTIRNIANPNHERFFRVEPRTCRVNADKNPSTDL